MNSNWKQDPRLKHMNPEKLSLLTEFAERVESSPKEQLLPTLLNLNVEANQKGIHFTDQETDLLISIMTVGMTPAEKKRVDALKLLSRNLSRKR